MLRRRIYLQIYGTIIGGIVSALLVLLLRLVVPHNRVLLRL